MKSLSERADALEEKMTRELEATVMPIRSPIFLSGARDPSDPRHDMLDALQRGQKMLMGADPRISRMPVKPTLMDFFRQRFGSTAHVMQSARLALKNGHSEKVAIACLLHDISVTGFICGDHGYWGAQLVAPYVDEEVAWAIRAHQALRFYPDASVGYEYPKAYIEYFGADFVPEPYIRQEYERAREHRWYMTSRLITVNDIYSFDPSVIVKLEDFTDLIGRHFKHPAAGLGFDASPSAHIWRTIMWPTRAL